MSKKKIIILIIFVILLVVSCLGYWYFLKNKNTFSPKETPENQNFQESNTSSIPESTINITGEVKEITDSSLSLYTEKENLEISINEKTKIFAPLPEKIITPAPVAEGIKRTPQPIEVEELKLKDVKAGDKVNVYAGKEGEKLTAINILILK